LNSELPEENLKDALYFFGLSVVEIKSYYQCAQDVWNKYHKSGAMAKTGISKKMFFDFKLNEKSDFDKICLLAFLALKSIIQDQTYAKIDNQYLLSRMDGSQKSIPIERLSEEVKKYSTRHHLDSIKYELKINWHLVYFSKHTRGFYVSFKLSLVDLIVIAEKRRKSYKLKVQKDIENEALLLALEKINLNSS
jgi:hypothetical protein